MPYLPILSLMGKGSLSSAIDGREPGLVSGLFRDVSPNARPLVPTRVSPRKARPALALFRGREPGAVDASIIVLRIDSRLA